MTHRAHARELLRESIVVDMCQPWAWWVGEHWREVLQTYRDEEFNVVFLTCGAREGISATVKYLAEQNKRWRRLEREIVLVRRLNDIHHAITAGKLAVGYMLQGTDPLEFDPNLVEIYYQLGVRSMQLAYNVRNPLADGCYERPDTGLSQLGRAVVEAMNRVGMLIDLSHTGTRSTLEAMEVSQAPVIFSHSVCRALYDEARNITDEQIRRLGENGGVIGINGVGPFLSAENNPTVELILRHVDHIVNLIGSEHVGLGIDYVRDVNALMCWIRAHPELWPEPPTEPDRYFPLTGISQLTEGLIARGYTDPEIKGILGANFLRVFQHVWK